MHGLTSLPWPGSCHQRGHQHFLRAGALTQGGRGVAEASQLALLPVPLALQQLLHRVFAQQVLGQHWEDMERGTRTDPTSRKAQGSSKDGTATGARVLMGWLAQPQGWGIGRDSTATRVGHHWGWHSHKDVVLVRTAQPGGWGTGGDSTAPGPGGGAGA